MSTITKAKCDQCGLEQEYITSTHWIRLHSKRTGHHDICSWSCLRDFADARHAEKVSLPVVAGFKNDTVVFS